jgi:glycosyltransferase involved in cell wall biosynthesis
MHRIFINGLSAKSGGGKSILTNYIRLLSNSDFEYNFIILVPDKRDYQFVTNYNIEILQFPKILTFRFFFPFVYSFILPLFIKINSINIVFNLADIPIKTSIKQIFLFDWPYAVYPKSEVWKMMDFNDFLLKKVKLYFFKKFAKYIDVLIAQTDTMRKHLTSHYGLHHIEVVPNAVSLDNLFGGIETNYNFPAGVKFLYLTHYYPHKNIEIFIDIAKLIKAKNLNFKLITTLDPDQHKGANKFLANVKSLGLDNIIINVGSVNMENVPSLYKQCDALLMPTLLESFSGTYVEAMFHKIPILTSNYDFSIDVCQNAALYFDPHNAEEILSIMERLSFSFQEKERLVFEGINVLNQLPDWNRVFKMYNNIIRSVI